MVRNLRNMRYKLLHTPKHTYTRRKTALKNIKSSIKFIITEVKWYIKWWSKRITWAKGAAKKCSRLFTYYSAKLIDEFDQIIDNFDELI